MKKFAYTIILLVLEQLTGGTSFHTLAITGKYSSEINSSRQLTVPSLKDQTNICKEPPPNCIN